MTATYEGHCFFRVFTVRDERGFVIARRRLWHPEVVRK